VPGHEILIDKGIIACKGIGYGKVHMIRSDADLADFPGWGCARSETHLSQIRLSDEQSQRHSHRFRGRHRSHGIAGTRIPGAGDLDTESATTKLKDGQEITVDAYNW